MKALKSSCAETRRQVIKEAWDYLGETYGTKKAVLEEMNITSEAMRKFIHQGYLPAERAKQFEQLSRGKYKREQFNPIFAP